MTTFHTSRLISAFENEMDWDKVDMFAEQMQWQGLQHDFPPIQGFESVIDEDDYGKHFMNDVEIGPMHHGWEVWLVTNGHHRSYAAIKSEIGFVEVEVDESTIVCPEELLQFRADEKMNRTYSEHHDNESG